MALCRAAYSASNRWSSRLLVLRSATFSSRSERITAATADSSSRSLGARSPMLASSCASTASSWWRRAASSAVFSC
eukprot:6718733-Prymnesium_polylepis.1